MRALRVERADLVAAARAGAILARSVRGASGRVAFAKGRRLTEGDVSALCRLPWDVLHVVVGEPGDMEEAEALERLACVAAGEGTGPGERDARESVEHWPIVARHRGVLEVGADVLRRLNAGSDLVIYTLPDGQVVDRGETVARVKAVPFLVAAEAVAGAERIAREAHGVVRVRPFRPGRVGVVLEEPGDADSIARVEAALREKVEWLGSELVAPAVASADEAVIADAVAGLLSQRVATVLIAGTAAKDPLEPAYAAVERLGGEVDRRGVPAHPGSLLWVGRIGPVPVVGVPSCGLFSRATVFDLVLPRLLAGLRADATWLAELGHGGLLTRDAASRLPPYRAARDRGEAG